MRGGAAPVKTSTGNDFPRKYQGFPHKSILPVLVLNFGGVSTLQYTVLGSEKFRGGSQRQLWIKTRPLIYIYIYIYEASCSRGPENLLHPLLATFGNFHLSGNFPGPQLPKVCWLRGEAENWFICRTHKRVVNTLFLQIGVSMSSLFSGTDRISLR